LFTSSIGDGESLLRSAIRKRDLTLCRKLLDKKTDYKGDVDAAGWTLLHVASSMRRLDIVDLLLNCGARGEINQVTGWGDTACHLAARCGMEQLSFS
jgi:ankyrin repeat protein